MRFIQSEILEFTGNLGCNSPKAWLLQVILMKLMKILRMLKFTYINDPYVKTSKIEEL
jgi:hypothetical protein